jgi:hypothetical protein
MTVSSWEHKTPAASNRMRQNEDLVMFTRQIVVASLLSLVLLSLLASILPAASGPLDRCRADAERLCPGVPMGGGGIVGCLKEHKMEVSVGCAKTVQRIKVDMGK